jgi:tetratricopeptide (TPR) repeat protein
MRNPSTRLLAIAVLLVAQVALGSEQSERLYSRGLVDFHAQRYSEALALFEQAVQADPSDPYALYYRGITHGRLGDYSAAATDLRAALAKKPDLEQAPLELGAALVQTGNSREALPWLETAQRNPTTNGQASLFLGIAQLRLGDLDAARANFTRAAAADPTLDLSARYYAGVADYRAGRTDDAQAKFSAVATSSPDSPLGHEAAAFLERLQASGAPPPYQLYAGVGFQYDSNVVLAPSNEALKNQLGISRQSDGRFTLNAGGIYTTAVPNTPLYLSLGYDFFQSLHFELHQFNLQDHRGMVQLTGTQGPVQFGMLGRYDYYFLEEQSFLQEGTALPWVSVNEGSDGRTEVFYRMRRRDFLKLPFNGLNDGFNHAAGIRQYVYLFSPDRFLAVGYRFDTEDPINAQGNQFGYDGHEINVGLGWTFPRGIATEADYAYRHETYAQQSAGRQDNVNEVVVAISKEVTAHLRVTAAYFGTVNNSNQPVFQYDRNVGSLAFEVHL